MDKRILRPQSRRNPTFSEIPDLAMLNGIVSLALEAPVSHRKNFTPGGSVKRSLAMVFPTWDRAKSICEMRRFAPRCHLNIVSNHLQFWQKLAEAANDLWPYSSMRTPSLAFTDVVVSGV